MKDISTFISILYITSWVWERNTVVDAFTIQRPSTTGCGDSCSTRSATAAHLSQSNKNEEENDGDNHDDDFEFTSPTSSSPEKSRMTDFIADFLAKTERQGDDTRISDNRTESSTDNDDSNSHYTHLIAMPVDKCHELMLELESVQRAILYHCPVLVHACLAQAITRLPLLYVQATGPSSTRTLFSIVEDVIEDHLLQPVEDNKLNEEDQAEQLNEYGTKPFTLRFHSLDIDGARNEVLHAVASTEDSNKLYRIVQDLQRRIHQQTGWKTLLPPDPQLDDSSSSFRARIPFMRLPADWDNLLEKPPGSEYEDFVYLPSEKGGNGISPIFWGKWADDDFGTARMREVAVYKRYRDSTGLDEKAFYVPETFIPLPEGTRAMSKQETHFEDYNENRILEAEEMQADLASGEEPVEMDVSDDDTMLQMTKKRLEDLYTQPTDVAKSNDISSQEDFVKKDPLDKPEDPSALDDWTRDRIQNIVSNLGEVKGTKELSKPKQKPPIVENEVFKRYKDGTLAPKQEKKPPAPELPPFPSRQHCVGFWKVLQSPTGFDVEETDNSRSDNLVLRVDGTTAGGPILDQNTRQKASGGTWRLDQDKLRIRLVIPPEKERILVMHGQIQLVSGKLEVPLAPSTFGIPQVEARKARAEYEMEDMIYCKGDVWVEDAITKKNRDDIGTFSLTKLNTSTNSRDFTITVPQKQSVEMEPPLIKFLEKTAEKNVDTEDFSLPAIASLDVEGELPRGAYFRQGNALLNPKDHCRLALSFDVVKRANTDEIDASRTIRDLQQYFDNGFQTFHVKAGSNTFQDTQEEILGRFFMETPQMVKDRCNVVIPMSLPSLEKPSMTPTFVRKTVTSSLVRLGLESVDCLQLHQDQESSSFLDILDSLEDLKREGLVQAISCRNLPLQQIRNAHLNDFEIASSQIHCSILDPSAYNVEQKLLCSDLGLPLLVDGSLAGGLLSDRYLHNKFEPLSSQLSASSRLHLKHILPVWNQRVDGSKTTTKPWQRFQSDALPTLSHIALKYRVSIATVCLRWLLQLDRVASSVISCSLLKNTEDTSKTTRRIKAYRDVFRFELDDDDMRQLWELSGMEEPAQEGSKLSF